MISSMIVFDRVARQAGTIFFSTEKNLYDAEEDIGVANTLTEVL